MYKCCSYENNINIQNNARGEQKKMKDLTKKKGISLIVLVITILVIVILAVAVIITLNKNNPIENAKYATEKNDIAMLEERAKLIVNDMLLLENGVLPGSIQEKVRNKLRELNAFTEEQISRVVVKENGYVKIINTPTIPNGFEHVEGTEVETGYVIRNSTDGNEFVWVPVDNIADFVREDGYKDGTLQTYIKSSDGTSGAASEPLNYDGVIASESEIEEYNAMKASVEKYKGFYIGRYEASDNGSGKAQSKANKAPWTNIIWGNSMTDLSGGAVEKARGVYPVENATKEKDAVSTLIYGVQWDATVRFLKINYPGIEKDSTGDGNYSTYDSSGTLVRGSKINTGSNDSYRLNEIYDMAGNCNEWTMEAVYSGIRILRGGSTFYLGTERPVSSRGANDTTRIDSGISFRLALYIK